MEQEWVDAGKLLRTAKGPEMTFCREALERAAMDFMVEKFGKPEDTEDVVGWFQRYGLLCLYINHIFPQ